MPQTKNAYVHDENNSNSNNNNHVFNSGHNMNNRVMAIIHQSLLKIMIAIIVTIIIAAGLSIKLADLAIKQSRTEQN